MEHVFHQDLGYRSVRLSLYNTFSPILSAYPIQNLLSVTQLDNSLCFPQRIHPNVFMTESGMEVSVQ